MQIVQDEVVSEDVVVVAMDLLTNPVTLLLQDGDNERELKISKPLLTKAGYSLVQKGMVMLLPLHWTLKRKGTTVTSLSKHHHAKKEKDQ